MLTTTADHAEILLPQYRDVVIEQRSRDYLVDGQSYRRVSSVLGVINKPALVGWARNTTLERVEETLTFRAVWPTSLRRSQGRPPWATTANGLSG